MLIRRLDLGGAERQLVHLANGLAARGHSVSVLSFYSGGILESSLDRRRVDLIALHKRSRWDLVGFLIALRRRVRAARPEVIYSFLTVPNLISLLLGRIAAPRAALVWGIRGTPLDLSRYDWLARVTAALERRAAGQADLLIANSGGGAEWARAVGVPAGQVAVVANGIDTGTLTPPTEAERQAARGAFGYVDADIVIAVVARLDPMKDHATFLRGFASAARQLPQLRALIAGGGPPTIATALRAEAGRLGIDRKLRWLGGTDDVARVYHAADLLCLPSAFGEGFPNVLGEAMAAGLPCIATKVGDSAVVLGPDARLVPPRDPEALASALLQFARCRDRGMVEGRAARERVVALFGLGAMVDATEALLVRTVAGRGGRAA